MVEETELIHTRGGSWRPPRSLAITAREASRGDRYRAMSFGVCTRQFTLRPARFTNRSAAIEQLSPHGANVLSVPLFITIAPTILLKAGAKARDLCPCGKYRLDDRRGSHRRGDNDRETRFRVLPIIAS